MKKQSHFLLLFVFLQFAPVFSFAGISDTIPDTNNVVTIDRSHSLFNNITSNPAYTGIFGGHNILINAGVDKPFFAFRNLYTPLQYNVAYDVAFGKKRNNAIGAFYSNSAGGISISSSFGLSYARNFNLTKNNKFYHKVRVGATITSNIIAVDFIKTYWADQIDPVYGFVWSPSSNIFMKSFVKFYPDVDIGAWYYNPIFYLGIAEKNIIQSDTLLYKISILPREFIVSVGGNINVSNNFSFHPSFNMSIVKGIENKLSTYSPAITCSFKNSYFVGLSYKDLNKITVHAGVVALNRVSLSVLYSLPTFAMSNDFGSPAYIGGDLRIFIKN